MGCYFCCFDVLAGEQTGKIATLYARAYDGLHLVSLKSNEKGSPACSRASYWLIKDEASVAGQSQFSQLLAAKLANKAVRIVGMNTCTRWPDGEDINRVEIID